jgi:hypothetical protein
MPGKSCPFCRVQVAYDKMMDAAKALAVIDDVQVEEMAEEVLADAELIDVLMTAEEEAA